LQSVAPCVPVDVGRPTIRTRPDSATWLVMMGDFPLSSVDAYILSRSGPTAWPSRASNSIRGRDPFPLLQTSF